MKGKYTKAGINEIVMFQIFGIELGMCDATITSWDKLEAKIDALYTAQEIKDIVNKRIML